MSVAGSFSLPRSFGPLGSHRRRLAKKRLARRAKMKNKSERKDPESISLTHPQKIFCCFLGLPAVKAKHSKNQIRMAPLDYNLFPGVNYNNRREGGGGLYGKEGGERQQDLVFGEKQRPALNHVRQKEGFSVLCYRLTSSQTAREEPGKANLHS